MNMKGCWYTDIYLKYIMKEFFVIRISNVQGAGFQENMQDDGKAVIFLKL